MSLNVGDVVYSKLLELRGKGKDYIFSSKIKPQKKHSFAVIVIAELPDSEDFEPLKVIATLKSMGWIPGPELQKQFDEREARNSTSTPSAEEGKP